MGFQAATFPQNAGLVANRAVDRSRARSRAGLQGPCSQLQTASPTLQVHRSVLQTPQITPTRPDSVFERPAQTGWGHCNQPGLNGLQACGTSGLNTGTFQVTAAQPVRYAVEEVDGLFDPHNPALLRGVVPGSHPLQLSVGPPQLGSSQRRFVVIDDNVYSLYGSQVRQFFEANNIAYELLVLPTNEEHKEFDLVFTIAQHLEHFKLNRRKEPIIAIGGGVCLDVAGLAANLFRRNTPIIKVPTTLMAAIDAAIGIKTAVNFHHKKNKMGTYSPPLGVFIDRSFLRSLDERNISNGAAEMLKMACVKDADLFYLLEVHAREFMATKFQGPIAGMAMRHSIQGMLEELEPNLWEHILCRIVDYGHTVCPEIEMAALATNDMLLHGEAVNIDMALSTQIAFMRGLVTMDERDRVFSVMRALELPFWHPVCSPALFMKGLNDTVAARDGLQRMPLMNGIGEAVFVNDVTEAEIVAAAAVIQDLHCCAAIDPVIPSLQQPEVPAVGNILAYPREGCHTPVAVAM